MSSPLTDAFIAQAAANQPLLAAIAAMYTEALVDHPDPHARGWREQLAVLMGWYDRAVVLETLVEAVPGLTVRQAVTLAIVAEREESGVNQAIGVG